MSFSKYLKEQKEREKLLETSLSRIYKFIDEGRPFGMITAFRDGYTRKDNLSRNKEMESTLRKEGFGFSKLEGHYIENYGKKDAKDVKEVTFFVIGDKDDNGKLKGTLKKLGKKYDQDSIFYKGGDTKEGVLIGTNTTGYPGMNKIENVGTWKPNKVGEFYSKMKGKNFVFESILQEPQTWLGRWANSKKQEEKEES
jgi:hypothetical protein